MKLCCARSAFCLYKAVRGHCEVWEVCILHLQSRGTLARLGALRYGARPQRQAASARAAASASEPRPLRCGGWGAGVEKYEARNGDLRNRCLLCGMTLKTGKKEWFLGFAAVL